MTELIKKFKDGREIKFEYSDERAEQLLKSRPNDFKKVGSVTKIKTVKKKTATKKASK